MGTLMPNQRALRARIEALALHAQRDPRETTIAARSAFLDRFSRQVDPDGILSPTERRRRAKAAKRAYMAGLALRSALARRHTKGGR